MTLSDQECRSPVVTVSVVVDPRGLRHPSGLPVIGAMAPGDFWTRKIGATEQECRDAIEELFLAPLQNAHLGILKVKN